LWLWVIFCHSLRSKYKSLLTGRVRRGNLCLPLREYGLFNDLSTFQNNEGWCIYYIYIYILRFSWFSCWVYLIKPCGCWHSGIRILTSTMSKMTVPETWVYLNHFLHLSGRGDFAEGSECGMMNNWKELATNRWDLTETLPWIFLGENCQQPHLQLSG
jgi:hypothetical protein